jgi:hypothetical protein
VPFDVVLLLPGQDNVRSELGTVVAEITDWTGLGVGDSLTLEGVSRVLRLAKANISRDRERARAIARVAIEVEVG